MMSTPLGRRTLPFLIRAPSCCPAHWEKSGPSVRRDSKAGAMHHATASRIDERDPFANPRAPETPSGFLVPLHGHACLSRHVLCDPSRAPPGAHLRFVALEKDPVNDEAAS